MQLSLPGRPDRRTAKSVIRTAVEAGVTLIDSADTYAVDQAEVGHNERLISEALEEMDLDVGTGPVVIATKGGRTRHDGEWGLNGRPEHLRKAVHASLRALRAERITLYQLHAPDPDVPFADSFGTLARLREEGKIEALGLSNVTVAQIEEARSIAPVASVQNSASVWGMGYRKSRVIEHCRRSGIVFLAYGPLGGAERAAKLSEAPALRELARTMDATPQTLAIAWLLHQAPIVVPIPGASKPKRIGNNLSALSLELDGRKRRRLRAACRTLPGRRGLWGRLASKVSRLVGR